MPVDRGAISVSLRGAWPFLSGLRRSDPRRAADDDASALASSAITVDGQRLSETPSNEATIDLLIRARAGDQAAIEALFARCIPALRRWARGRLPAFARDLADTQDLVQEAVMHALHRLHAFEHRHQGALQAYLRQAVHNRIVDEVRRAQRRPVAVELVDHHHDPAPSPIEHAMGREGLERYEAALERLRPGDREAIVGRIELQQSYEELAVALNKPSANSARVAVKRAIARLLREMDHAR
jgi:RNA polymerase sigma factor (sigma-70 family)